MVPASTQSNCIRAGLEHTPAPSGSARTESSKSARPVIRELVGVLCTLWAVLWGIGLCPGLAQIQTTDRTLENLKREFTDPLTTLPQLFFKVTFSPVNYGTNVQTNQVVARAIIPRIPPNTLLPFVQLVRPTFSLVTVPTLRGGTRTDFGDMQLFDLAVPPWPSKETGLRFGLGRTFVFPTATSKFAGQGAWQAGPAFAAVYTGVPRMLIGFLLQNPISFAYTSPYRLPQNSLAFPTGVALFFLGWLVLTIRGCNMGVWVAPSCPISVAAEFGRGSSDGSSRFTATQLLCFGPMDGLSPKFANHIPVDCQLWSNDRPLAVRKR